MQSVIGKKNKAAEIAVNVIVGVIMAVVILITINVVVSAKKGYVPFFGKAAVAVQTGSMDGGGAFERGDLLFIGILDEEDKKDLRIGDVITFRALINGKKALNSHRIARYVYGGGGNGTEWNEDVVAFMTKGDNNPGIDDAICYLEDVVGKFSGSKIDNIGFVQIFFNTTAGFLVCILLPSLIVVGYCVYLVIRAVRETKKGATAETVSEIMENPELREAILAEEKERMRKELLEELRAGGVPEEPENGVSEERPDPADSSDGRGEGE